MNIQSRKNFIGSNNVAKAERLPEGAVADSLNVDFTVGGKAELRTGFERVLDRDNVRGLFEMGDSLALVAAESLLRWRDGVAEELASVSPGPVAACWHNDELLLNTMNQSMRVRGSDVQPWAVHGPAFDVEVVAGHLPAGVYRIGVTAVQGVESGCLIKTVTLGDGQALRVHVDDDRECHLYCSIANGSTLFHQGRAYSLNPIMSVFDESARLETAGLTPLPFCSQLVSHQALIVGAEGRYLFHTEPMWPHLHNPESGFIAFPAPISLLAAVAGGLFVCAEKTYFISGLGGPELARRTLAEFGAVSGTATTLPDGSVAWFTQYGQAIGRADGSIELLNRGTYAPDIARQGAAGFLEHNGNQMVVTSMRGEIETSRLQAGDHWGLEVIDNE